ncbi:MAG: Gfo/Idh/MocA family oxidoreductase [Armatimonadetes bacterium]|nr:Gfo/Idh/MocA family oxidoreductase [Armatimonadota bacterium]
MTTDRTRRAFIKGIGLGAGAAALAWKEGAMAQQVQIQGFEKGVTDTEAQKRWKPISDRKIRVGIAGYGVCQFGAAFGFQNHPNVTVAAVTDLFPDRCATLAQLCNCGKTYPSCEEMIKDDSLEAVFIATDAVSHARLAIAALKSGKHVASAVPAVFGSLEEAEELYKTVKATGRKYMMFETSYFHDDLYAMREMYKAGLLGKVVYAEGEYFHFSVEQIDSYKGWRVGLPPQWYPTHSNAYYTGVTGLPFTEVSCMAMPSIVEKFKPANNRYKNPFATEIALFRTADGGMARMAVSWDTPGDSGEKGRIRTQQGSFYGNFATEGRDIKVPVIARPPLPPGVEAGGHGGSHGYLMAEFVEAILANRKPLVDISQALTMTAGGIVAHKSALKGGELMKVPQYPL